ncbi:hypothetical protein E3P92_03968 [Wallemia ichthyophaga]|nr:hypothetical protein E3P97_03273 [Wallemia ichthyophaga]TIA94928.1 hypothetical protein E3P95_03975 [Wallemia ichthyophaga]TIA95706.1 hypothetical protein E3P94_03959 [Wallemia ichthyophaga]TIB02823.1 hypothetical protein E3P96_02055 [Wallemia ichthyophaga]TIB07738.1 hypothetical protein E3P92_03968 [Wallemia ichthyophaga]
MARSRSIIIRDESSTHNQQYKSKNIWNYPINQFNVAQNKSSSKELIFDYLVYLGLVGKFEFLGSGGSVGGGNGTPNLHKHIVCHHLDVKVEYRLILSNALDRLIQSTHSLTHLHLILNLFNSQKKSIFNSIPRGAGPEAAWIFPLRSLSTINPSDKAIEVYNNGCKFSSSTNLTRLNNLIDVIPSFIIISSYLLQDIPKEYHSRLETLQQELKAQSISLNTYQSLLDGLNSQFILQTAGKGSLMEESCESEMSHTSHPSTHWYTLFADLLTYALIQGYMEYEWKGVRPAEVLLGMTRMPISAQTTSNPMSEKQKLSNALKMLFSDKSIVQAEELDGMLRDRLGNFLDMSESTSDLGEHLHALECKFAEKQSYSCAYPHSCSHSNAFDARLLQFFADFDRWLGVARLGRRGGGQALLGPSDEVGVKGMEMDEGVKEESQSQSNGYAHTYTHTLNSARWFVVSSSYRQDKAGEAHETHDSHIAHISQTTPSSRTPARMPSFTTNACQVANPGALSWPGPYGV